MLHEIKKKEQEIHRVREQMKKSVGEKGLTVQNSFEVFANVGSSARKASPEELKYNYLLERN